jgi:hypothetical protein
MSHTSGGLVFPLLHLSYARLTFGYKQESSTFALDGLDCIALSNDGMYRPPSSEGFAFVSQLRLGSLLLHYATSLINAES